MVPIAFRPFPCIPQDGPTVELPPWTREETAPVVPPAESPSEEKLLVPVRKDPARVELGNTDVLPGMGRFVFGSFVVLALLVVCAVFFRRLLQRSRFRGAGMIRILASKPLAPKQEVFLVEVGSKVFLVGATKDRLATLGEFAEPGEVSQLRMQSPPAGEVSSSRDFQRALREGIGEAEEKPASRESFDGVFQELQEIRKTVMGWKA